MSINDLMDTCRTRKTIFAENERKLIQEVLENVYNKLLSTLNYEQFKGGSQNKINEQNAFNEENNHLIKAFQRIFNIVLLIKYF